MSHASTKGGCPVFPAVRLKDSLLPWEEKEKEKEEEGQTKEPKNTHQSRTSMSPQIHMAKKNGRERQEDEGTFPRLGRFFPGFSHTYTLRHTRTHKRTSIDLDLRHFTLLGVALVPRVPTIRSFPLPLWVLEIFRWPRSLVRTKILESGPRLGFRKLKGSLTRYVRVPTSSSKETTFL